MLDPLLPLISCLLPLSHLSFLEAFRGSGHLREDYALLCHRLSLVGHHELMPESKDWDWLKIDGDRGLIGDGDPQKDNSGL